MTTIKELADKFGQTEESVQARFDDNYGAEIEKGVSDEVAEKKAMRITELSLKRETMGAPTEQLLCVVIGTKEPMDNANKDREKAIAEFKKNPKKAIAEHITDENGTPLDRKKDFGTGSDGKLMVNKNYLKPMKPSWMRVVACMDLVEKKLTTFILKNEKATELPVPYNVPIILNGTKKTDGTYQSTKSTRVQVVATEDLTQDQQDIVKDLAKGYRKCLKDLFIELDELEEWVENHGKKDIFMVEADVIQIDMVENAGGSRTVFLDNDTEYGQRAFVPQTVPIMFAEFSRVIMTASAKPSKNADYGPSVTAMGFYPMPEFLVAADKPESFDTGIDYNKKREVPTDDEETESEWTEEYQGATGEEQEDAAEEPKEPVEKPAEKPKAKGAPKAKEPAKAKQKTATPMLMVKIIGTDGPISMDDILEGAVVNGYSMTSARESVEAAVKSGEVTTDENGDYILAEE